MGGYTALALARRSPERMLGIVLAGSRALADSPERRVARDETIERLRSEGTWPELETDVDAEELALAQEAMRDRPDASGVVASSSPPPPPIRMLDGPATGIAPVCGVVTVAKE